jgi:hypothetical protein
LIRYTSATTDGAVIEPHAFGGPGGIRTPVQDTFLFASYSNNTNYNTTKLVCQVIIVFFTIKTNVF